MGAMSYLMFSISWNFLGFLLALGTVSGFVNYIDILEINRHATSKRYRSRRATYFNSLTYQKQEDYLNNTEKQLKENLKLKR